MNKFLLLFLILASCQLDRNYGNIYFNRTLNDWGKFDINKRTKFDATISSGLAIMACNRHLYAPNPNVNNIINDSKSFFIVYKYYVN